MLDSYEPMVPFVDRTFRHRQLAQWTFSVWHRWRAVCSCHQARHELLPPAWHPSVDCSRTNTSAIDRSRHDAHTRSQTRTTHISTVLASSHHSSWSVCRTRSYHDHPDGRRGISTLHCPILCCRSIACHTDEEGCLSDGWQSSCTWSYERAITKIDTKYSWEDTYPHEIHLEQQAKKSSGKVEGISGGISWLNFSFNA